MDSTAVREKKLAALKSVGSSLILVSLKVFLAAFTGSLGILSEALHSSLDLVSTVITFFAVSVSDRPPDESHPYGHGKVENISAWIVTGLLILASLYIIYEAIQRLFFFSPHIEPSLLAVLVLGLTVVVDYTRARALRRAATKHSSEALEADALHFSSDMWSTFVVMGGITAVWAGEKMGVAWLRFADPIAALLVSGVIIWVGSQLGKRTLDALLDAAPQGLAQRIENAVAGVEGVLGVERLRVRRAGNRHFVDITITVPRSNSFELVHATSDRVEQAVQQIVPADVMVHMEPRAPAGENLFDSIRALAQRRGLPIHELSAQQLGGRTFIDLHLEVDDSLTLREAHRRASELEEDIRCELDGAAHVNIHIEPFAAAIPAVEEMSALGKSVRKYVNSLRSAIPELLDCHEVRVRAVEHRVLVSCHCAMEGNLPITRVHDVTEALQDRVKEKFPQIFAVTIHPEPLEES